MDKSNQEKMLRENKSMKEEIKQLLHQIKKLQEETSKYKNNFGGGILPEGFAGYNQ